MKPLPIPSALPLVATLLLTVYGCHLRAEDAPPSARRVDAAPTAPLLEGMGAYHRPVRTRSPLAQRYFNQGMVLTYGFNHAEAIRSFRAAVAADPDCAMAWWGIAYALGPNINAPMDAAAYADAWEALQQGLARAADAPAPERAFLLALKARYRPEAPEDRSGLDRDFVEAARAVTRTHPDDLDAQVILVEAILNTMPWDYWTPERTPRPDTVEALATLQQVLRRNPDHPGANHFLIHAVEAGPSPEAGLPSARRLAHVAPGAGHLVHMPSHIFIRVGQYADAVEANLRAVAADEQYLAQCRSLGLYDGGYYPHNLHFLWYAHSLQGNRRGAIAAADKVAAYALDRRCGAVEGPRLRSLQVLARTQFGRWDEILATPVPPTAIDFDRALFHHARSLAHLGRGEIEAARAEAGRFRDLADAGAAKAVENPMFPAGQVLEVAGSLLDGRLALAAGDPKAGLGHLREAVAAEDAIAYMEPPFWHQSTRWTLGAALLRAGESVEAEAVFRRDLDWLPRNGWALHGLEQALRDQGKDAAADAVRLERDAAWRNADVAPDWSWY